MHLDLTIAIPVKNEEKNIAGCLEAIGPDFARRVVLIDSGSTDETVEIAMNYGAEIVNFRWDGRFPKKRNWYLRNFRPDTKWILFLDADEYLSEDFKSELRDALQGSDKIGYWLRYTVYFLGKELKGGYPLRKLALFRVGAGEYERIDEEKWSKLDMEVHEHPILEGAIGELKSKIDHQDFRGISHYILKHNEYASWEAYRYIKSGKDAEFSNKLTKKQRLKYWMMGTPLIGVFYFFGSFIFLGGFRDGTRGLAFAILKMSYFTQVYCKIREIREA